MSFRRVVQSYLPPNVDQLRVCAFLLYIPIMLSCFEFHPEITLCAVRKMRERTYVTIYRKILHVRVSVFLNFLTLCLFQILSWMPRRVRWPFWPKRALRSANRIRRPPPSCPL